MEPLLTSPTSSTLIHEDVDALHPLHITEVIDRLQVMRQQEEKYHLCTNYIPKITSPVTIDEVCRTKMIDWCLRGADRNLWKRESVVIATSYLDRFLSTDTVRAKYVIRSRKKYQLACVTTLYMAVKLFEPFGTDVFVLTMLINCGFTGTDITLMELDILSALNWHVNNPTVFSFIDYFLALIPAISSWNCNPDAWSNVLEKEVKQCSELAIRSYHLTTSQNPSTIAIAILSSALEHKKLSNLLDHSDRIWFLSQIAMNINVNSREMEATKQQLASIPNYKFSVVQPEPTHSLQTRDIVSNQDSIIKKEMTSSRNNSKQENSSAATGEYGYIQRLGHVSSKTVWKAIDLLCV